LQVVAVAALEHLYLATEAVVVVREATAAMSQANLLVAGHLPSLNLLLNWELLTQLQLALVGLEMSQAEQLEPMVAIQFLALLLRQVVVVEVADLLTTQILAVLVVALNLKTTVR
jgi:hypothetical protein